MGTDKRRMSTKALGSRNTAHVVVTKPLQNLHDPPHAFLVGEVALVLKRLCA